MQNMIETKDLCKMYGNYTVVDHINLCVPKGCVYGFIGPNGEIPLPHTKQIKKSPSVSVEFFLFRSGGVILFGLFDNTLHALFIRIVSKFDLFLRRDVYVSFGIKILIVEFIAKLLKLFAVFFVFG